jgi:hypothetical protein
VTTVVPELRRKEDLAVREGQVVSVIGTYFAVDTSPHAFVAIAPDGKVTERYVIGEVDLDDKTTIRLGVRPADELKAFDEKKVVIIGRLVASPARGPGIMAQPAPSPWLIEIESVVVRPA